MDHFDRLCRPPASPPEPPPRDPDIIDGPRIPLVYGTAATEISVSRRAWRMVRGCDDPWRQIDDMSHTDNCVGKLAHLVSPGGRRRSKDFVVHCADDGFLIDTPHEPEGFWSPKDIRVVESPDHLNIFEKAIRDAGR